MLKNVKPGLLEALLTGLIALVALAGGATSIIAPHTLPEKQYLDDIGKLAFAVAGLGGGKGIALLGKRLGEALGSPAGIGEVAAEGESVVHDAQHGGVQAVTDDVLKQIAVADSEAAKQAIGARADATAQPPAQVDVPDPAPQPSAFERVEAARTAATEPTVGHVVDPAAPPDLSALTPEQQAAIVAIVQGQQS